MVKMFLDITVSSCALQYGDGSASDPELSGGGGEH